MNCRVSDHNNIRALIDDAWIILVSKESERGFGFDVLGKLRPSKSMGEGPRVWGLSAFM